jgi:hypothetical protein
MTILEKIKFEEDWLSEVNLTKENIKIAFAGIRSTVLEQELSEDCISRQAVNMLSIDLVYVTGDKADFLCKFWTGLDALPSVTPKAEWIPVSERLPEDYIHVLCQFYLGGMGECYLAHGVFHVVDGLVMTCNEVVAWMPLPEPYKEEKSDGK